MLPAHQLQGELAISVPRHRHLHVTITVGKGWFPYFCCSTSFCTLRFALQLMLPAHQLQGELAISVPRHRHPRATITAGKGWGTVCAQRGTQPRPPKAPCEATAVKTAWARTSPHLQQCDRGVDGPGAGDDGPTAAGEGGHVACAPAAGRVSNLSTEAQAPARDNHSGQGMVSVLLRREGLVYS